MHRQIEEGMPIVFSLAGVRDVRNGWQHSTAMLMAALSIVESAYEIHVAMAAVSYAGDYPACSGCNAC